MKMPASQRERLILVVFAVFVVALFIQRGIYLPHKDRQESLKAKIERMETLLNKNERVIQKSKAYEQKYAALLDLFQQKGTEDQVMSAMLTEIEKATAGIDVQVSDMKPQRVKKEDLANNFSVSIVLDGTLDNVVRYVHQLQVPPHLFQVAEMRLERKSFNSSDLRCFLVLGRVLVGK